MLIYSDYKGESLSSLAKPKNARKKCEKKTAASGDCLTTRAKLVANRATGANVCIFARVFATLLFTRLITSVITRSRSASQRGLTNMEVCQRVATTAPARRPGVLLPMPPRFTFARGLQRARRGHSRRSFALRRVRSLSLSVNLKSNYTRLRSQAVTQFVVIPAARVDICQLSRGYRERTAFVESLSSRRCK